MITCWDWPVARKDSWRTNCLRRISSRAGKRIAEESPKGYEYEKKDSSSALESNFGTEISQGTWLISSPTGLRGRGIRQSSARYVLRYTDKHGWWLITSADTHWTPAPEPRSIGFSADFVKGVVWRRVIVRLKSGVDRRGTSTYIVSH